MKKQIIAIDLDDVLGKENDAVRRFVNDRYGLNHTPDDYLVEGNYGSYWEDIWNVSEKEAKNRYEEYVAAGVKYSHEPVEGSFDAISKLKQEYDLVVVTARGDRHVEPTHKWLDEHFPKVFSGIEFMPLWGQHDDITKAYICKQLGASYLIDDHIAHCRLAAQAGIECLLFGDYGWNRNRTLPKKVIRTRNWNEVLEYFDARN